MGLALEGLALDKEGNGQGFSRGVEGRSRFWPTWVVTNGGGGPPLKNTRRMSRMISLVKGMRRAPNGILD